MGLDECDGRITFGGGGIAAESELEAELDLSCGIRAGLRGESLCQERRLGDEEAAVEKVQGLEGGG